MLACDNYDWQMVISCSYHPFYIYSLGFYCEEELFFLFHLSILPIIYISMGSWNFVLWVIIHYYYFITHIALRYGHWKHLQVDILCILDQPLSFFFFFFEYSSEDTPDSAASCSSLVMLSTISPKTLGFFNWRRVFWNWDCGCKVYTFYWVFEESFDDSMEIGNESWLFQSLGKHPGFHEELSIDHIWMRLRTSSRDQHPHWVLTQVKPAC